MYIDERGGWPPSRGSDCQTATAGHNKKWWLALLPTAAIHLHNSFAAALISGCIVQRADAAPVAIRGSLGGGRRPLQTLLPSPAGKPSNSLPRSSNVLTLDPERNGNEQEASECERGVWQTWCRCGWQSLPHQQCSISTLVLTLGCASGGCPYLVFLDMVTVLSGDRVLWSSPSSLVGRLAISTSSTSCNVSRSFSLIPALGLKTPRWRGSSSGTSGSRWAPTIWIFLFDLGENKAVKHIVLCGAMHAGKCKVGQMWEAERVSSHEGPCRVRCSAGPSCRER